MYCNNCGKEIDDKAIACPHCGVATANTNMAQSNSGENTIAIVGFVFSFLISLVGLICSIMGYKKAKEGAPYKGLSLAGIIISIIGLASYVFMIAIFAAAGSAAGL